ncbi:hypothetical protein GCM10027449_09100 [Sinomonas notoginsengisoli]|uniref:methyltransferase domain-containing protein n=1 Tax=Sinomonas notoginsengisoli TaxID=1457311 RepID=UPI001F2A582B|nr:methyltransferase domain-containing protein [Sinomonas notoginsengisoli]
MSIEPELHLDTADLEARVKGIYEQVADNPSQEFHFETGRALAERLGYPPWDLDQIPSAAVDSFAGVGYFHDLAALKPGERVLDLGSGSGTDSFLSSISVGARGSVIGIDMTAAQLAKARRLAAEAGNLFDNIDFREGRIESPAVEAGSMDCVISNGVINLAPDKDIVFAAAADALRRGGRLVLSDIVTRSQMPETVTCDASLWAACIGGAMRVESLMTSLDAAGFLVDTTRANDDYRFLSRRARKATDKYGVTSLSVLCHKA